MIRTVIFDIDNVLARFPWDTWAEEKFGGEKARRLEEIFRGTGYLEELEKGAWKLVHFMARCIEYAPECEGEIRAFLADMGRCPEPCGYAIPWVEELKTLGYQVLYLANCSYVLRRLCPEVLDFIPHMDGGIFSCDVGMAKPDAGIYARICGAYDLDPAECLFVDDGEPELEAARAYGMHTMHFDGYETCYPAVMELLARSRAGRPRIGVTCRETAEAPDRWDRFCREACLEWIREAGGEPMLLPLTHDPAELARYTRLCDGFLFSGGEDVDPSVYGGTYRVPELDTCPARDRMEEALLDRILREDKPVLGIGRGMQLINGALCGDLWQDLTLERGLPWGEPGSRPETDHFPSADAGEEGPGWVFHPVRILRGTPLHDLLDREHREVNSRHHQGVKELSRFLREMAVSPDGLCEALWMPGQRFVWGLQWHPEWTGEGEPARALLEACGL